MEDEDNDGGGIMEEWKRAKGLSQMIFPTTKDAGLRKNFQKIAVKWTMKVMVAITRKIIVKGLQNELECKVAGLVFSVAVLAHSAKNQTACVEGFVALEGLYCLLQFPLSCAFVAFSQGRAARQAPSKKAT